jgi:hypothetical protein
MKTYECLTYKRTETVEDDKHTPECCDQKMKNMPREICLQPAHAEHARPMEEETACDEFREG